MKRAILALAFLLLLTISASSQTPLCTDTGSIRVDTLDLELTLTGGGFRTLSSGGGTNVSRVVWEVYTDRTSTGRTDYTINASSVTFTGDGSTVNTMTTAQIFDLLAQATVSQGVALGLTKCPASCTNPAIAKVVSAGCVHRSGSDSTTHFEPCVPTPCCIRTYTVCCPNGTGSPVITLLSAMSPGCGSTSPYCESTCP